MLVSYLRVSSKGQVQGDGLSRQRDVIHSWGSANRPHEKLEEEFVEDGFTGTAFDRPALGELLVLLRELHSVWSSGEGSVVPMRHSTVERYSGRFPAEGEVTVLVERSDRLARDNLAAELILQEFRSLGVKVIDCEANLDLTHDDDPSKVLIRQILQAVAEFDKSSLVKKLRKARDRKRAKDGRCEGVKPYGSLPGEKKAHDLISESRRSGMSIRAIRDCLNGIGYKARSGRPWSAGAVAKIVQRIDREGQDG